MRDLKNKPVYEDLIIEEIGFSIREWFIKDVASNFKGNPKWEYLHEHIVLYEEVIWQVINYLWHNSPKDNQGDKEFFISSFYFDYADQLTNKLKAFLYDYNNSSRSVQKNLLKELQSERYAHLYNLLFRQSTMFLSLLSRNMWNMWRGKPKIRTIAEIEKDRLTKTYKDLILLYELGEIKIKKYHSMIIKYILTRFPFAIDEKHYKRSENIETRLIQNLRRTKEKTIKDIRESIRLGYKFNTGTDHYKNLLSDFNTWYYTFLENISLYNDISEEIWKKLDSALNKLEKENLK